MRRMSLYVAIALFISLGFGTKSGAVDFASPVRYPVESSPIGVVVADFNGDGKGDLVVVNEGSATVSVLLGNGNGTFQAAKSFATGGSPGDKPVAMAAGDFNGDRRLDLIILNGSSLGLCWGKGDGTFLQTVALGTAGVTLLAADFNLDGKLDLVAYDQLLLGNGDGTFQSPLNIGTVPVLVGDFNGDGKPDLLAGGVLLGNGDGTFRTAIPLDYPDACHQVFCSTHDLSFAAADYDGDGKLDLAILDATRRCIDVCSPYSFATKILLGNGNGTFRLLNGPNLTGFLLLSADFNGDGKPDLLSALTIEHGSSTFDVVLGTGDGSFAPSSTFDVGSGPFTLLAADLNGDHLPDIVSTDYAETAISVLLNTSPTTGSDLALNLSPSSANITVGTGDVSYTATVLNQGPQNDSEITLKASLPSGLTLVSAQPSQGTCTGGSTITCELGTIQSTSFATVQFTITPTIGGNLATVLDVSGAQHDLNTANNSVSFTLGAVVPDFSLSPASGSLTMSRGGQASDTLTFPAQGGFAGSIALTCLVAGPAPIPTCGIAPASVNAGGSATLTIDARALTAGLRQPSGFDSPGGLFAARLPLGVLGCVLATGFNKKRRRRWALCLMILLVAIPPTACGGGSTPIKGPPPQNFAVTVTATSGALQHSTTISITVQ